MARLFYFLSKVPIPSSMHHARPITILSCLYRLLGKFIFKVTARTWKRYFRFEVSGGLPGRGVKELAFLQKRTIESSLIAGSSLAGYCLDLVKAYNIFGRYAVGRTMTRLGMPQVLVHSWLCSLDNMMRYPTIQGCVGFGIASTPGVPEGCSISVLSMLPTSCLFHSRLKGELVRPFTDAGNWSWMSKRHWSHFLAYQQVLRLASVMRLTTGMRRVGTGVSRRISVTFVLTLTCSTRGSMLYPACALLSRILVKESTTTKAYLWGSSRKRLKRQSLACTDLNGSQHPCKRRQRCWNHVSGLWLSTVPTQLTLAFIIILRFAELL